MSELENMMIMILPFTVGIFIIGYFFGKTRTLRLIRSSSLIENKGTKTEAKDSRNEQTKTN